MERIEVTRRVRWEAAHYLPFFDGDCSKMHGHSWSAEITLTGDLERAGSEHGMVMDMGKVAKHFKVVLEAQMDHACLNDILPARFQPPSTENVARFIMASYLGAGFPVVRVTVRETENQTATVYAA
jgi:6-pyruvoyltetrahydropterin/6-carboxytetrahydropterin synthase